MNAVTALRRPAAAGGLAALWTDQAARSASPFAWVNALRSQAHADLDSLAVPTLRDEAWRFTDLAPLAGLVSGASGASDAASPASAPRAADIAPFELAEAATRLVFVDGVHSPALSRLADDAGESGVLVANLPAALASAGPRAAAIERHLGRHQTSGDDVFVAFNTAWLQDAAVIVVPRNVVLAAPLHVLFITTAAARVSHPRCLLVAEAGSSVTLIEDHVALQDGAHLSNPVSEIVLDEQARVQHVRVQRDSQQAFHLANTRVTLGRASHYQSVSVDLGAKLSRHRLDLVLGEGAECAVDGLAIVSDSQLTDTHSCIVHAEPHGRSRQLHKCIAGGTARAVFNGKVVVRPGAQRTDAGQMSRNLLLGTRARIDTQPQLEIQADDVKCTHGATVAPLDTEEVFYLQSRGLSDRAARDLLTYAFGAEIIARIPLPSLRQQLQQRLLAQTGHQP
jgi:Fe-S cluster assembly protein SufD